jgi:cell division protease FtsH
MDTDQNVRARLKASLATATAYCAVVRAFRSQRQFRIRRSGFIVLKLPANANLSFYRAATEIYLDKPTGSRHRYEDPFVVTVTSKKGDGWPSEIGEWLAYGARVVALCDADYPVSMPVSLAADAVIILEPPAERDLIAAWKIGSRGRISLDEAKLLLKIPISLLDAAARNDRSASEIVSRVTEAGERLAEAPTAGDRKKGPLLDDLVGMGEAEDWGRELARDLADWKAGNIPWSAVDRGILLSGPPGCGKTTFAKALANTCGVEFVSGSLASWQAAGHLNALLKSMREAFATARTNAPAIMFIDEIDAFGDRARFSGDNAQYSTEVVAGLLECLDGVDGREGVVVVGAANYPDKLDAAITRSGRLDRHVRISLPDEPARAEILWRLLERKLDRQKLLPIAGRLLNRSGADLERLVREASRRARRAARPPILADIEASLPPRVKIPREYRRRIAIHEAGHVVVGLETGYGTVTSILIPKWFDHSDGQLAGCVQFEIPDTEIRTLTRVKTEITMLLAGAAAEKLVLGNHSAGVGGKFGSDLHRATALAATSFRSWGLGDRLTFLEEQSASTSSLLYDPTAHSWVADLISSSMESALGILHNKRSVLETLAKQLLTQETMSGERIGTILKSEGFDTAHLSPKRRVRKSLAASAYSVVAAAKTASL